MLGAIRLIEPQLDRKQPAIDECYYLLCMLADEEPAGLEAVRDRVWRHRRHILDHRANFEAGNFGALFETLTLTLRCEKCGEVNRYDVKSVVYGKNASEAAAFVRDDIRCASCGQWADFELTTEAYMQMSAALLVRATRRKTESDDADSQELIQFIDVHYRWQTRPAPEVMAELKSAAEKYPDNIVNQLRLARLQYVFGRRGRAEECYQAALRLEPNSMEAGLGLAQILSDGGRQSEAFDRLCQMLDAKNDWRFFRTDELSPKSLADEFARLFNKLHGDLRVRHRPLLHATAVESRRKVGRNDPCPCGSERSIRNAAATLNPPSCTREQCMADHGEWTCKGAVLSEGTAEMSMVCRGSFIFVDPARPALRSSRGIGPGQLDFKIL